jgi:methylase of polypeptide subunit release factors
MEFIPNTKLLDHSETTTTLSSGKSITYSCKLEGGGIDHREYFLRTIAWYGKPHYQRAFEWCAGHAIIGFEILTNNIADTLTLSDYYDLSIDTCIENAKKLGFSKVVYTYLTSEISNIPITEKWDLVVGNPPNAYDRDHITKWMTDQGSPFDDELVNSLRIVLDTDWQAHREFFKNLKDRLSHDADIFLSARDEKEFIGEIEKIANGYGFVLLKEHTAKMPTFDLSIFHFKYHE